MYNTAIKKNINPTQTKNAPEMPPLQTRGRRRQPARYVPRSARAQRRRSRSNSARRARVRRRPTRPFKQNRSRAMGSNVHENVGGIEALTNNIAPTCDILQGLPAELAFQISAARPGTWNTPFVLDNNTVDYGLNTGICNGFVEQVCSATSQATTPLTFLIIGTAPSYLGNSYVSLYQAAGGFTQVSIATGRAQNDVWGVSAGFTDKFQIYQLTARITIRSPIANVTGVAYVGRIQYSQIPSTGSVSFDYLRLSALEVDLKEDTTFEVKAAIHNRGSMHISGASGQEDEYFTYVAFPSNVATSITDGAVANYTVAVSLSANYAWVPDYTVPALTSITSGRDWPSVGLNPLTSRMIDVMDKSRNGAIPQTLSQATSTAWMATQSGRRTVAMNSKGPGRPGPPMPRALMHGPSVSCPVSRVQLEAHASHELTAWKDFTAFTKATWTQVSSIASDLTDWAIANAITMGKRYVVGAVAHMLLAAPVNVPPCFIDDARWLAWCMHKSIAILRQDDYDPDTLVLCEEMFVATEELIDRLLLLSKVQKSCVHEMNTWTCERTRRGMPEWMRDGHSIDPSSAFDDIRRKILADPEHDDDSRIEDNPIMEPYIQSKKDNLNSSIQSDFQSIQVASSSKSRDKAVPGKTFTKKVGFDTAY